MKLLIVDDEKVIRETISRRIPWQSLGIDVVKTASNGLEAYDIIMDEYPDIVMTDIKMPGLSGLQLIQRIKKVHPDVEFIILSGYGEFEFAREAMQYGVHHYLLKPCKEEQIVESVRKTMDQISKKRLSGILTPNDISRNHMENTMILNIINELAAQDSDSENEDFFRPYEKFMDFDHIPYELCYLYFLDENSLPDAIKQIELFRQSQASRIRFHMLYVHQTMVIFFPSYCLQYDNLDTYMENLSLPSQQIAIQYQRIRFNSLKLLLEQIVGKVKRYEAVSYNDNGTLITICNYRTIIREIERLSANIYLDDQEAAEKAMDCLFTQLYRISDPVFLKQLLSSIIMQASSKCLHYSSLEATEFLVALNPLTDTARIMEQCVPALRIIYQKYHSTHSRGGSLSTAIDEYVRRNLSDSNLSLKWIAENILYMHVDYVSKRFFKETGQKFSKYLTDLRIQKAKELLMGTEKDKIQNIAELVGCGNNPQYFSQLFRKTTGMTPSAYIKYISGGM